MKTNIIKWFRIVLGLFLIIYATNQFLHFIPTSYGVMPENTENFIDAVVIYLPFLYIFEILIGILLIANKWPSFITVVLFPLTISFLIFNISNNDYSMIWPALVVAFLNVVLLLNYRKRYKSLFQR